MKKYFFLCLLFIIGSTYATKYYVDFNSGNDSKSGTSESAAWKHAPGDEKASGNASTVTLSSGDIVLFKGGIVYRGNIEIKDDGSMGNPITFKGDGWGSEKAIVDGSELVTATWIQCQSANEADGNPNWQNIWYADLPEVYSAFMSNLHENDEYLYLAQHPSPTDPFFPDQIEEFITPQQIAKNLQDSSTFIIDSRLESLGGKNLVGKYVALWEGNNVTRNHIIKSYDSSTKKITFEYVERFYEGSDAKYALVNYVGLIDAPGEYVYDETANSEGKHKTFFWPQNGNPNDNEITISVRGFGINFRGRNYLTIEGFKVQKFSGQDMIYDWKRCGVAIASIGPPGSGKESYITIRNNKITGNRYQQYAGYGGIYLTDGSNCIIENNVIEKNACHKGIFLYSNNEFCIIRNNKVIKPGSHGIWVFKNTKPCAVINNEVSEVKGIHANGMTCFGNKNIYYIGNKVFAFNYVFAMNDCKNIILINNILHAMDKSKVMMNFHNDTTIQLYNNSFLNSPDNVGIYISTSLSDVVIKNNIIDGILCDDHSSYIHDHNIYVDFSWNQDPQYNWKLSTNEKKYTNLNNIFVKPDGFDFHLKDSSIAVDRGVDITSNLPDTNTFPFFNFSTDMEGNKRPNGNAWDIGPYESNYISGIGQNQLDTYKGFPSMEVMCKGSSVTIKYNAVKSGNAEFDIFDLSGRLIRHFLIKASEGTNVVRWNGCNDKGEPIGNGYYIVKLQTGDITLNRRFILQRK